MTLESAVKWQFCPVLHKKVVIRMCAIRLETCASALERFNAPVSGKKISSFLQLFLCEIFPWFCGKRRFFLPIFTSQTLLKWQFCPVLHKKVAIHTRAIRLETCASALERFNAPVSGKKNSSFLQLFLCEIFPWFCGKWRYFEIF